MTNLFAIGRKLLAYGYKPTLCDDNKTMATVIFVKVVIINNN